MNLFVLSLDPEENAAMHCDQHVVKMILEATQVMCTTLRIDRCFGSTPRPLTKEELSSLRASEGAPAHWYKATHPNHPLCVWARSHKEHYRFVRRYALSLHAEFQRRFGKRHRSGDLCETLPDPVHPVDGPWVVRPVLCMPDRYKGEDPVQSYRSFYSAEKTRFAQYRHGPAPAWLAV